MVIQQAGRDLKRNGVRNVLCWRWNREGFGGKQTKAAPRAGLEQTQIDHSYDAQENIKPIPAQPLVHDV